MKILIVSEFFPEGKELNFSGGVEARNYFVAKHIAKKHRVTIITTRLKNTKKVETISGIKIIRIGKPKTYLATTGSFISRIKFIKEAIQAGSNIDFDVIEGTNFITHFIVSKITDKKKKPKIAWYPDVWIGSWIKNTGLTGFAGEMLERLNLKSGFDAYIAISERTQKKLEKYIKKSKIVVIPCGVNQEEFKRPIPKTKLPTIITITRLAKYKNVKALIFAAAKLSISIKNLNLIIVGRGPEFKNLQKLTRNLKISKRVRFVVNLPRKELVRTITSSSVFCLPSYVEGFGIAVIESAAAGLPYVVSDIKVFNEITNSGKGGYLVDPNNVGKIEAKLRILLTDSLIYRKKAKEAKELSKLYNWEEIANSTEDVYKKAIMNFGK